MPLHPIQKSGNFTFGLELEFVDCSRLVELPKGCSWNKKELTLVNSDGTASIPTSENNLKGGEVNTVPTRTIAEQVDMAKKTIETLREAGDVGINYRCNTQVHIGLPKNLHSVHYYKKLVSYFQDNFEDHIRITMGNPQKKLEMPRNTWLHYKERKYPDWYAENIMNAETLEAMRDAFFTEKSGRVTNRMIVKRAMVNFNMIFKTGSIEFRGFWGTMDYVEISNCIKFCVEFVYHALTHRVPIREWGENFGPFPKELPFIPELEEGFQKTKKNFY